jgi:hypothetical protein
MTLLSRIEPAIYDTQISLNKLNVIIKMLLILLAVQSLCLDYAKLFTNPEDLLEPPDANTAENNPTIGIITLSVTKELGINTPPTKLYTRMPLIALSGAPTSRYGQRSLLPKFAKQV